MGEKAGTAKNPARDTPPELHTTGSVRYSLQFKPIRRINMRLNAPDGLVLVTAPFGVSRKAIDGFVRDNEAWIARQRERLARQPKAPAHAYVTGETEYLWGKPLKLQVLTDPDMIRQMCGAGAEEAVRSGKAGVLQNGDTLILACPAQATAAERGAWMEAWFRRQLGTFLPFVFSGCSTIVGKRAASWYIRKMTTRWGTCNIRTGRVCVNLLLVHLPPEYLSYIVIHELTHLWEGNHGERFKARLDESYPAWRQRREELKRLAYML